MSEKIDVLDFIINILREHEKKLDSLIARFEELLEHEDRLRWLEEEIKELRGRG